MTKIINFIQSNNDKVLHFLIGFFLFIHFVFFIPGYMVIPLVFIIGVLIEEYQKRTGTGEYDINDALSVLFGAIYGFLIHHFILN